jgi:prefoldin subunit 5
MITDELRKLFDGIKSELMLLRTDMTLINHDLIQIREQLDRIENSKQQSEESIGIAPGTPPPTFKPPEYL